MKLLTLLDTAAARAALAGAGLAGRRARTG